MLHRMLEVQYTSSMAVQSQSQQLNVCPVRWERAWNRSNWKQIWKWTMMIQTKQLPVRNCSNSSCVWNILEECRTNPYNRPMSRDMLVKLLPCCHVLSCLPVGPLASRVEPHLGTPTNFMVSPTVGKKNMVASLIYKAKRCANWATANSQENFVLLSVLFALALFQILTKPDPRRQPCSSNSSATSKSEFSITCSLTCLLAIE